VFSHERDMFLVPFPLTGSMKLKAGTKKEKNLGSFFSA
jgi:hypothetical protein